MLVGKLLMYAPVRTVIVYSFRGFHFLDVYDYLLICKLLTLHIAKFPLQLSQCA